MPGLLRPAHRGSARDAGGRRRRAASSPPTTASRSTRSTARRAAAAPKTPRTSSARRCPIWCRRSCEYKHPTADSRSPPRDRFAGLEARRPRGSRGVSTFADAARFMGLPDRGEPPADGRRPRWRRSSGRRSIRRSSPRPISSFLNEQGHPAGGGCSRREDLLVPAHRQEGSVRMAAGRADVVGRTDDAAARQRPAEGVHARARRAHLPAHRRRAGGDDAGARGSAASLSTSAPRTARSRCSSTASTSPTRRPTATRGSPSGRCTRPRRSSTRRSESLAIGDFTDLRVLERGPSERAVNTGDRRRGRPSHAARAAPAHAARAARQPVLLRHRAQRARRACSA